MPDGPVYIAAMRVRSDFVPVLLSVIAVDGICQIGLRRINGSVNDISVYRPMAGQRFADREQAQMALDALARNMSWKPYEKPRRWNENDKHSDRHNAGA